ncbi:MAG: TlpA family protein disulfide reductase [Chloroflexota bacterium]|nr:TlpA family protein disulfide reductase [Chloroflexota bacterium]
MQVYGRRAGALLAVIGVASGAWVVATVYLQGASGSTPAAQVVRSSAVAGQPVAAREGAVAPDFRASLLDGSRATLSQFRGRAVLLNFWASWCGACAAEIKDLQRLQQQRVGGLAVIGVNVGEGSGQARAFLHGAMGATYASFLDPNRTIAGAFHVTGLPVSVFIDRGGVIRRIIAGQLNYQIFDRFARVAMGEADVPGVNDPLPLRFVSPLPPEHGGGP